MIEELLGTEELALSFPFIGQSHCEAGFALVSAEPLVFGHPIAGSGSEFDGRRRRLALRNRLVGLLNRRRDLAQFVRQLYLRIHIAVLACLDDRRGNLTLLLYRPFFVQGRTELL